MLKIRSSSLGKIMMGTVGLTDKQQETLQAYYDRTKPLTDKMKEDVAYLEYKRDHFELLKTTTDYLRILWLEQKYNRRHEISSKYMSKGTIVEDDSIDLLSVLHGKFYVKNEKHFENDFITGTPDITTPELRDIKSSWNLFTFHKIKSEGITDDNFWQAQGYMALTDSDVCYMDYCLVNTPEQLIDYEKRKVLYNPKTDDSSWYSKKCKEIDRMFRYDDIPSEERCETFEVKRDDEKIKQIYERVILCRDWIDKNLGK